MVTGAGRGRLARLPSGCLPSAIINPRSAKCPRLVDGFFLQLVAMGSSAVIGAPGRPLVSDEVVTHQAGRSDDLLVANQPRNRSCACKKTVECWEETGLSMSYYAWIRRGVFVFSTWRPQWRRGCSAPGSRYRFWRSGQRRNEGPLTATCMIGEEKLDAG